ncbi:hypothetical protein PR048_024516 [Dryococelus australis]|uniref:DDE-1 domain-containing protein n=1 Tax=Dryococelus australis TaxID=614101 RepID=A0ABQ9GNU8_9NEOP|nr:hypothetical protein PR048_024516 [Dryococelus australis]
MLDGHASHTKSLRVIEFARKNHIILVSLPPHTTHTLQLFLFSGSSIHFTIKSQHFGCENTQEDYSTTKTIGYAFGPAAFACNATNGLRKMWAVATESTSIFGTRVCTFLNHRPSILGKCYIIISKQ